MTTGSVRVGLFGLLGSGNIGNDASMESVLHYLRTDHPDAIVDAMCPGPARVTSVYGIEAFHLWWYHQRERPGSSVRAVALKVAGKAVDAFRIASWVRRHDVVIVPGMGVLEATLPLRPLGEPYAMFLLSAFGRLFRTKVAFVSIGASVIRQRLDAVVLQLRRTPGLLLLLPRRALARSDASAGRWRAKRTGLPGPRIQQSNTGRSAGRSPHSGSGPDGLPWLQ